MKILYKIVILLAAAFLTACQTGASEAEALKSEVIKVHDRIMPRNAELIKTKARLRATAASMDSLKQANSGLDTGSLHLQIDSLAGALDKADQAMSDWMHEFKTDYSGMEQQAVIDYLTAEKEKISGIEQAYEQSIGSARSLLESL